MSFILTTELADPIMLFLKNLEEMMTTTLLVHREK
jgi:hypothetical protein